MITEDYVSFETAKLLKEKGFDCSCEHQYINCSSGHPFLTDIRDDAGCYYKNSEIGEDEYSAPTLQMVMKWLREIHNIKVNVFYSNPNYAIEYFELNTQTGVDESVFIGDGYDVFEHACEAAIKYCLENLI